MTAPTVIGLDLVLLGLCIAYWEWRFRTHGWGRGWMHEPKHRLQMPERWSYHGYVAPDPWAIDYDVDVRRIPETWEFDLPLPPATSSSD